MYFAVNRRTRLDYGKISAKSQSSEWRSGGIDANLVLALCEGDEKTVQHNRDVTIYRS
jgi:hypothetical protein